MLKDLNSRCLILNMIALWLCFASFADPGLADNSKPVTLDPAVIELCHALAGGDFESVNPVMQCRNSHGPLPPFMQDLLVQYREMEARRNETFSIYLNDLDAQINEVLNSTSYDPSHLAALLMDLRTCRSIAADRVALLLDESNTKKLKSLCLLHIDSLIGSHLYVEARKFYRSASFLLVDSDPDYIDYMRQLNELALIQSIEQNYPQIKPDGKNKITADTIFSAIRVLDFKYVSVINYKRLAEKVLYRCNILGMRSPGISHEDSCNWKGRIESESITLLNNDRFGRDHLLKLVADLIRFNSTTLKMPEPQFILNISQTLFQALDGHTLLVWPHQKNDFQKKLNQEYSGIGITLEKTAGSIKIQKVFLNTPAFQSNLKPHDQILEIDGQSTAGVDLQTAVDMLTGPVNTPVELTIICADNRNCKKVVLQRGKIVLSSIQGWLKKDSQNWDYILDEQTKIGYIKITGFTKETASDFRKIMTDLQHVGINALILDLRFNPGGSLSAAVEIADLFIESGPLLKSRPRWGYADYQQATEEGAYTSFPMVVLINGSTASAAEVLAGILRDPLYRRAILVGEKTYGKGSVQTITSVPGTDALLKYTVSRYCLPSGQEVASRDPEIYTEGTDYGIMPDIEIKLHPYEQRMIDAQYANSCRQSAAPEHDDGSQVEDLVESDAQLAVGLLILKSITFP